jgi:cobalt-zinc-cadmium efflux system outer membrane protein
VLERRQSAGSASGYEQARLNIECELSRSHWAEARASLESDKKRLAALLGQSSGALSIEADLTLISPEREQMLARAERVGPESLGLSQEAERYASRASEHALWSWFPTIELGAGLKRANNAGSADGLGYFVGANMGLPFFDRGQGQMAQAEAARVLSSARSDALSRRVSLQVEVAALSLRRARAELDRFERATSAHLEKLLRAAQGGYREGERSVVELLDAERAQTEVALRRLLLLARAKRAETQLRSAAGELK